MEKLIPLTEAADEPPEPGSATLVDEFVQQSAQKNVLNNSTGMNLSSLSFDSKAVSSILNIFHENNSTEFSLNMSLKSRRFRDRYFPDSSDSNWNDWHWQLQNRITDLEKLERIIKVSDNERQAINRHSGPLPISITPYYASLMDPGNTRQAIRRMVVSVNDEYKLSTGEACDPLGEDAHSPVPGLVHRYPDRVLFLVTGFCSVNCRYCTRSRMIGQVDNDHKFNVNQWEEAIHYIERHEEIRDVLLSGGDPLTLSNNKLEWLLRRIRRISHVEIIRIGTKVPTVLPQRINPDLTNMLKKYHPLWMSIHFSHPDELTPEVKHACRLLAEAAIPLGSQTVLLKGINDSVDIMKRLNQGLMKILVKPYYLYQCDPVIGSAHFRTTIEKGLEIIHGLRGFTSGYAVPHYVIDAPGGGGKIPILPDYMIGRNGDHVILKNYEGHIYQYPDPHDGNEKLEVCKKEGGK